MSLIQIKEVATYSSAAGCLFAGWVFLHNMGVHKSLSLLVVIIIINREFNLDCNPLEESLSLANFKTMKYFA